MVTSAGSDSSSVTGSCLCSTQNIFEEVTSESGKPTDQTQKANFNWHINESVTEIIAGGQLYVALESPV